jgi:hypothetical protein
MGLYMTQNVFYTGTFSLTKFCANITCIKVCTCHVCLMINPTHLIVTASSVVFIVHTCVASYEPPACVYKMREKWCKQWKRVDKKL